MEMRMRAAMLALVLSGMAVPVLGHAQGTGSQPVASVPAAAQEAAPLVGASWHPNNKYWHDHDQLLLTDFGDLARFKDEDAKLGPSAAGENRVVFMGDSITEGWHLDKSFPGKPYVNRGISGQTTAQMVLRFHQDVIALRPKVVVILAGINDMAENTGPMTLEQTEDNLEAMAEMASANGIKVVMCSVLPATHFSWHPGLSPASEVAAANVWMKAYAAQKGHVYVDFYTAMKDDEGGLPPNLSRDGVHPMPAGTRNYGSTGGGWDREGAEVAARQMRAGLLNVRKRPTMVENDSRKGLSLKRCPRKRFIPTTPQWRLSAPAEIISKPVQRTRATSTWKSARTAIRFSPGSSVWWIRLGASSVSAASMPSPTGHRQWPQPSKRRRHNR